jgi:hypothetical protein
MFGVMFGAGWAAGDEANSADDEEDAGPAVEAEVLVQPKAVAGMTKVRSAQESAVI